MKVMRWATSGCNTSTVAACISDLLSCVSDCTCGTALQQLLHVYSILACMSPSSSILFYRKQEATDDVINFQKLSNVTNRYIITSLLEQDMCESKPSVMNKSSIGSISVKQNRVCTFLNMTRNAYQLSVHSCLLVIFRHSTYESGSVLKVCIEIDMVIHGMSRRLYAWL